MPCSLTFDHYYLFFIFCLFINYKNVWLLIRVSHQRYIKDILRKIIYLMVYGINVAKIGY